MVAQIGRCRRPGADVGSVVDHEYLYFRSFSYALCALAVNHEEMIPVVMARRDGAIFGTITRAAVGCQKPAGADGSNGAVVAVGGTPLIGSIGRAAQVAPAGTQPSNVGAKVAAEITLIAATERIISAPAGTLLRRARLLQGHGARPLPDTTILRGCWSMTGPSDPRSIVTLVALTGAMVPLQSEGLSAGANRWCGCRRDRAIGDR